MCITFAWHSDWALDGFPILMSVREPHIMNRQLCVLTAEVPDYDPDCDPDCDPDYNSLPHRHSTKTVESQAHHPLIRYKFTCQPIGPSLHRVLHTAVYSDDYWSDCFSGSNCFIVSNRMFRMSECFCRLSKPRLNLWIGNFSIFNFSHFRSSNRRIDCPHEPSKCFKLFKPF